MFKVHLWLGIGFGLYVLMISLSGSAIVLRPNFSRWFVPSEVAAVEAQVLTGAALERRVAQVYAGSAVTNIIVSPRPERAVYVELERSGSAESRFFDQYQGKDLGSTYPWQLATMEWLTRLHDELLLSRDGRKVNGIGGALFLLMVVTGLLIWWRGNKYWHEGLLIRRSSRRSLLWQLHGFLGIWSLFLMFVWGFTAVYFAWPEPFERLIDYFDPDLLDAERPDGWLLLLIDLHFGRFRGVMWTSLLWVVLGLLPAVMFISGFILWYRRVVSKIARRAGQAPRLG